MERWKQIDTELVLDSRYFKVRRDNVELPNGEKKEWTYWDSPDSAMLVGITNGNKLVMIRQYRYLVNDTVIEFPAGSLHKGETAEEAAMRELEEESGYTCKNIIKLGSFYETYGQLNRQIHIFFSKDLIQTKQHLDSGDNGYEEIQVNLIKFDEALDMALGNKMVAMGSTLAMLILNEKIRKKEICLVL